jgi:hypothetical protein
MPTAFKRLGFISFDSNERSNFQARELKSAHVNVVVLFVRLVVHRCHVNKLNIYNQARSLMVTAPLRIVSAEYAFWDASHRTIWKLAGLQPALVAQWPATTRIADPRCYSS